MDVYNAYAEMYATELADPVAYPDCAPLTTVATLLGVDPSGTTAPATEEPRLLSQQLLSPQQNPLQNPLQNLQQSLLTKHSML